MIFSVSSLVGSVIQNIKLSFSSQKGSFSRYSGVAYLALAIFGAAIVRFAAYNISQWRSRQFKDLTLTDPHSDVYSLYFLNPPMELQFMEVLGFKNSKPIMIYVYIQDLCNRPFYHLRKLCNAIKEDSIKYKDPRIIVNHLQGRFKTVLDPAQVAGIADTGGVSRDYLSQLTIAIIKRMDKYFVGPSDAHLPSVSQWSSQIEEIFGEIGSLMMYCYNSESSVQGSHAELVIARLIGRHFDDGLFKSVLSLEAEEIDRPIGQLSLGSKLKMCKALVQSSVDQGVGLRWLVKQLDGVLNQIPSLNDSREVEAFLYSIGLDYKRVMDKSCIKADFQKDKSKFIEEAFCLCVKEATSLEPEKMFAAFHAIAKGMKNMCKPGGQYSLEQVNDQWGHISQINYQELSAKVQGNLLTSNERQLIAKNIIFQDGEISEQIRTDVRCIQEWLVDPATPEKDVQLFLKFATGASASIKGRVITVSSGGKANRGIVPVASTCTLTLTFPPSHSEDLNEKEFIGYLKQEMARVVNEFDRS